MTARLRATLSRLRRSRRGVTALEYSMIAATVVVAIAALMPGIGSELCARYRDTAQAIGASVPAGVCPAAAVTPTPSAPRRRDHG